MKRNMKKTLVSGLALSMLLPLVPMEPAEAAGWKQDGAGLVGGREIQCG